MPKTSLPGLVSYCDRLLRLHEIPDYDRAVNGLQVANNGKITRVAAAVDATLATVRLAIEAKADFLLVHHGLFWSKTHPWTGHRFELIKALVQNNLAVYSAHLPLDAHPAFGNNAQLCAALGFRKLSPFFEFKNCPIGLQTTAAILRDELVHRVEKAVAGPVRLIPGGPQRCKHIGIVTGGAGGDLEQAVDAGLDTFITGEGQHWTYGLAEDLGINLLYAGHYATETFGVKALAAKLSRKFSVPWKFIDHPTGL